MKNDIAQAVAEVRMMTAGQLKDICAMSVQAIPTNLTFEQAEYVLSRKTEYASHVQEFFPSVADLTDPVKVWERFYQKYFGLTLDLSGVKIPERTPAQVKEFTRLIIVAMGLLQNQVYDACHRVFKGQCWRYVNDLDASITENERDSKTGAYAIWVRDTVEADEVHKNKSADMVKVEGLKTETSLERNLHELKYFAETGKHLDIVNATLCSGSRISGGDVPGADWCDDEFRVYYWYGLDDRNPNLRPREEVSRHRSLYGSFGVKEASQLFVSLEISIICLDSRS